MSETGQIDLAKFRRMIASEQAHPEMTESGEPGAVVSLRWLHQVEREITAGRTAQAQLRRVSAISAAQMDIAAQRQTIEKKDHLS